MPEVGAETRPAPLAEALADWAVAEPLGAVARTCGVTLAVADPQGELRLVLGLEGGRRPRGRVAEPPGAPGRFHRRPLRLYGDTLGEVLGAAARATPRLVPLVELFATLLEERLRTLTEADGLSRELLNAYEELNFFHTFAQTVAASPQRTCLCRLVLEKVLELVPAGRGAIFLFDEKVGRLVLVAASSEALRRAGLEGKAAHSLWQVYREARPVLAESREEADEPARSEMAGLGAVSMLAVPVTVPTEGSPRALGVLLLLDREDGRPFQSPDLKVAEAAAGQMGAVLNIVALLELEREVQLARDLQTLLLPSALPQRRTVAVAGRCVAAKNVGGDYYDVLELDADALDVVVADVSGHSLASGLLMTTARTLFRCAPRRGGTTTPAAILGEANALLYADLLRAEQFISAFYLRYHESSRRLVYANAGHNPPLLWRAGPRRFERLEGDGMLLGILPAQKLTEQTLTLAPGDVLVLYTDGVVEAKNGAGALFGEERFREVLARHMGAEPPAVVGAVFAELRRWAAEAEQSDDITLVVLKVKEG